MWLPASKSMGTFAPILLSAGAVGFLIGGCGGSGPTTPSTVPTAPATTFGQTLTTPATPGVVTALDTPTATTPAAAPKSRTRAGAKGGGQPSHASGQVHSGAASGGNSGNSGAVVYGADGPAGPGTTIPAPAPPVTRTVTVTVTDTITTTQLPDIPRGAQLPSAVAPVHVAAFQTFGGNIGCVLSGDTARCDIAHRVWHPPAKPRSCNLAWAQGIVVSGGAVRFVCAGDTALDPGGPVVGAGLDDKVGSVTCQVRSFGVTCFEPGGPGFFISRTGYDFF